MKTSLIVTVLVVVVAASAIAGYAVGFRQAWELSQMAGAAPRAHAGLTLMHSIDVGRTDQVTYYFESQIDAGLLFWHDLSQSRLYPMLNQLSGDDVFPSWERSVRPLAEYRKTHPSPLMSEEVDAQVSAYLEKIDPTRAAAVAESSRKAKEAMEEVVAEYAQ